MNEAFVDFEMSGDRSSNAVLQAIAQESLNFLFSQVAPNRIKSILLTGSVANGEGTVIHHGSTQIVSDFDFLIYVRPVDFLNYRSSFQSLSQEMTGRFLKRGVATHVTFTPYSAWAPPFQFANSDIYEYEFAYASKCLFGIPPLFNRSARPTRKDALELTFEVVSDLVFSNFRSISKVEESYLYAKRALTLLNSLFMFNGIFAKTYRRRAQIARKYVSALAIPLSYNDVETLEIFTEYKLSGSLEYISESLACSEIDDLVKLEREFLEKLTRRVLFYELVNLTSKPTSAIPINSDSRKNMIDNFPELLRCYFEYSKLRRFTRIMGIGAYLFWCLTGDKNRKDLFASFIFHKQSPKAILNATISSLFMREKSASKEVLKVTFPWLSFDDTSAIQRLFSLWQTAESSVKFN